MSARLAKCPACGSEAAVEMVWDEGIGRYRARGACTRCPMTGPEVLVGMQPKSLDRAAEAWNLSVAVMAEDPESFMPCTRCPHKDALQNKWA